MPGKRKNGSDTLTGGTKDVNPQYLSGRVTMSAANTVTTAALATPIVRVGPMTNDDIIIIELLKLFVDMPMIDLDAAAATTRQATFLLSTVSFGTTAQALDEPRVFAMVQYSIRNAFTAAGTGSLGQENTPYTYDFTDGAGHGILIATESIFAQATTANFTAAGSFPFKLLYRFKRVTLAEYIGIVQSQQ